MRGGACGDACYCSMYATHAVLVPEQFPMAVLSDFSRHRAKLKRADSNSRNRCSLEERSGSGAGTAVSAGAGPQLAAETPTRQSRLVSGQWHFKQLEFKIKLSGSSQALSARRHSSPCTRYWQSFPVSMNSAPTCSW
jgi:hypothetical protein